MYIKVGFSYIDDYDLMQSVNDINGVLSSMQELINNWGILIEVTCRSLRADKCWYCLVEYIWKRGKGIATYPII